MIRLMAYSLPLYLMLAAFVWAQDTWEAPRYLKEPDSVILRAPSHPGDVAELVYHNSASMFSNSIRGEWVEWTSDEGQTIRVKFSIQVQGPDRDEGREILTILEIEPDEFVAYPVEARVLDGETFVVRIVRPMF